MAAVRAFVVAFRAAHPGTSIEQALQARTRALAAKGCRPEELQHSFPER